MIIRNVELDCSLIINIEAEAEGLLVLETAI